MKKQRLPLINQAFGKGIKTKEALTNLTSLTVLWDDFDKVTIYGTHFQFTYTIKKGASSGVFELDKKGNQFKNESKLKKKLISLSKKQLGI